MSRLAGQVRALLSLSFDPTGVYGVTGSVAGATITRLRAISDEAERAATLIEWAEANGWRLEFWEDHHGQYDYWLYSTASSFDEAVEVFRTLRAAPGGEEVSSCFHYEDEAYDLDETGYPTHSH